MNRHERRQSQSEFNKNKATIENLTPSQTKLVDLVAKERAKFIADDYIAKFGAVLDRNFSAAMLENGFKLNQVDEILSLTSELTMEDMVKTEKLEKEGNVEMIVKKIEMDVRKEIERLMDLGETKSKLIDAVLYKFPSISKSMAINAYAKIKEAKAVDPDVNDAMEKIADILGEDEKQVKKVLKQVDEIKIEEVSEETIKASENVTKVTKDITKSEEVAAKHLEDEKINGIVEDVSKCGSGVCTIVPPSVSKKLKVKDLNFTVDGENGKYSVTEEKITLKSLGIEFTFENRSQLHEFMAEFEEVFYIRDQFQGKVS